jgi:hypothetical protein
VSLSVAIGVVAHPRREQMANRLASQVGAEVVSWDMGHIGAEKNHLKVWEWLAESGKEWGVVLEDDVIPCRGFHRNLGQAMRHAPTPIVSLYLGRGRCAGRDPLYQQQVAMAIVKDVSFLTAPFLLSAQGYLMRTELFAHYPQVRDAVSSAGHNYKPIDEAISDWAVTQHPGNNISYCRYSIVDHRDGPTVVEDHRDVSAPRTGFTQLMAPDCDPIGSTLPEVRKAWLVAGVDTDWTKGSTSL